MVRPDVFIPVAEEIGLMGKITDLVIEFTMLATRRLNEVSPGFHVGLNISSTDVKSGRMPECLIEAAHRNQVDLSHIGVEITESGLLEGNEAISALNAIKATGVRVLMDDFGTGFSSLAYLMRLDVDCLKIDRLFVDAIGTESATSNVISHMIDMANTLSKMIIAEGVETEEQAHYLREHGVQMGQGYLFGRPMPLEDLIALLESKSSGLAAHR